MSTAKNPLATLFAENAREYGVAAGLGVLLLLNLTGAMRTVYGFDTAILITAVAGYKTFYNTISALLEREISADVALCVAVIAALSVGEYRAAAEAMFIVMVGETLESFAAGRTEAAIERFIVQMPRIAHRLVGGREQEVDAAVLVPGDHIAVRAGERIAADGIIEEGISCIDESPITGEPLPQDKQPGDEVFSGTLNGNGLLRIRVTRAGQDTTLARVVQLVEEAKRNRAPVERLADRYARYFLPALLLAGGLTYYFTGNWLRTVAVLIVACPCALILATPTAMVAAIGGLARRGILVRGGTVLQQAAQVDTVAFDKTGTVTEGRFAIVRIAALDRSEGELLGLAGAAEQASGHALARVIVEECRRRRLPLPPSDNAEVLPGRGAQCTVAGRIVRAGNAAYLAAAGIEGDSLLNAEADRLGATAVLVADGPSLVGAILLRDTLREGAREAVEQFQQLGISELWMLTGDRRPAADIVAREIGIPHVAAELLPEWKLERIREFAADGRTVAMLGDGINDAPALAAAGVGIAVSGAADIAAHAAGVVFLPHSLATLPSLFQVSRRAMRTAWLNIVLFACGLNLLAVIACATGRLGPMGAALTHQLSSFCVMMNSLRLLYAGPPIRARLARLSFPRIEPARLVRPAVIAAAALVVLSGFYAVQPDEVGVVERFGRKITPFSAPGLHYKLPWPIEKLTRIRARGVRVVEIGYRSNPGSGTQAGAVEPVSYEWNVQHRGGRFESRPEEALALTGDQNMIELNANVHYRVERPDDFLFRQVDGDVATRQAAESVIHGIASAAPMDDVLTAHRHDIEQQARIELQTRADRYQLGIRILQVKLEDVHPSREVVDAFREVSAAFEEKNRLINEAEAYRNEQVALARGNAKARLQNAAAYTEDRTNRAAGDASRFDQREQAYRTAPGPTQTRLYLETMEQVLAGRKKFIVDSGKGRRHLLLLEDGVELTPPLIKP